MSNWFTKRFVDSGHLWKAPDSHLQEMTETGRACNPENKGDCRCLDDADKQCLKTEASRREEERRAAAEDHTASEETYSGYPGY